MSKERLVEFLGNAPIGVNGITLLDKHEPKAIKQIADYLLANGVIVPPCKVGDKVYMGDFPNIRGCIKRGQYLIVHHETVNMTSHINFKEIGKTVFFTKEEAEAKLKEMNHT